MPSENNTFSTALSALKNGKAIRLPRWEDGVVVSLVKGCDGQPRDEDSFIAGVHPRFFERGDRGTLTRLPSLSLTNPADSLHTVWTPSTHELLSAEWIIND